MSAKRTFSFLPGSADILREVLPNGVVVLARANFSGPSVSVGGYLPAGALFETDDKLGLADFVASALMRGTEFHTFDEIYDWLESVGASAGFDAGVHNLNFGGRALADDLPLLLNVFAESLRFPTFPKDELEKLRAQLLTGLSLREQDTYDMASLHFDCMLFKNHPYGRPDDGYVETIQAITRRDIQNFHRACFGPKGMTVAIVGGVEPKKAVEMVWKALGDWNAPRQKTPPELPPHQPVKKTVRHHHRIAGKAQSDLIIGTIGPRRHDPEYFAAALGNSILGQFGMMGRIGESVREKAGLAYYASSSLHAGTGPGSWEVSAGVNPKNLERAIDLIMKELRRFVKDGVTRRELEDVQANYIGSLPLSLESNGGVASKLLNIERYGLGLDYYLQYEKMIRSVDRASILATARKYIDPDKLVISTAGP